MSAAWLIQNDPNTQDIISACHNLNIEYILADKIPFDDKIKIHGSLKGKKIIPYGSTSLIMDLYTKGICDGLFFNEHRFRTSVWNDRRDDMLNKEAVIVQFREGHLQLEKNRDYFIRPNSDLKTFSGHVTNLVEYDVWVNQLLSPLNDNEFDSFLNSEVVIAPYQRINAEYRCFVVGGNVVDASMYREQGVLRKKKIPVDNFFFRLQELANGWLPDRGAVCMDVANVGPNNELKVIEFNCINATGFYDNDIHSIVKSITKRVNVYC